MPLASPSHLSQRPLIELLATSFVAVNGRCHLVARDGVITAVVAGVEVVRYAEGDQEGEDLFIAQAIECDWASTRELATATGRGLRSCSRVHRRLVDAGPGGLRLKKPGPTGPRLGAVRERQIRQGWEQGLSNREMARRLGVDEGTIRNGRVRMGLTGLPGEQQLDLDAAPVAPQPDPSVERGALAAAPAGLDPLDRTLDRVLAYMGQIDDAEPIFAPGTGLPRLGVLLALPLIVGTGLFEEAERLYGSIGPAFYGLRTSLLVVVLMALLRIKHPESLKEYSPPELGRIIGLDRAPEVKTLRRKLKQIAEGPSETLIYDLAKRRVQARDHALGFLYVDGHVRVYSGKYRLPKGHVTRMRMSLPATEDVWVNDADGDPIFFITQEAHPSLVTAMQAVVEETRELLGDRRLTFVFDRGGWSPKLFKWLVVQGFDVINYRKGTVEPIPEDQFEELDVIGNHGSDKTWLLHDCTVSIGTGADQLQMRQVTRLQNGHQTHIVTTRMDLSASEIAHRMFHRWTQENFFKYMRDEFALDALLEYGTEEEDPLRDVPNPDWRRANNVWRKAKTKLKKLEAAHGALVLAGKTSTAELLSALERERTEVDRCKAARDQHEQRVTIDDLRDEDLTVRLPALRKRLSDGLKMLAYQVESDLVRAVAPHYRRVEDEGRTLIAAALQSAGDIELDDGELRITLAPQSSPHRTRAVAELCHLLDDMAVTFPGTQMRVRYAIRESNAPS